MLHRTKWGAFLTRALGRPARSLYILRGILPSGCSTAQNVSSLALEVGMEPGRELQCFVKRAILPFFLRSLAVSFV